MLVANLSGGEEIRLELTQMPWPGATVVEVRMVDDQHAFDPLAGQTLVGAELALKLPVPAVALVTLRPQGRDGAD